MLRWLEMLFVVVVIFPYAYLLCQIIREGRSEGRR